MKIKNGVAAVAALGLLTPAQGAAAQEPAAATPAGYIADSASPFGVVSITDAERAAVEMPKLAFSATPEDAENFDKYYYFHRPDTDFATSYADISECDGYARGLRSGIGNQTMYLPYAGTMAGAVGGAVGSALAVAIFGSAEKRRLRRVNMRTCMNYKGYGRYGLPKDLWKAFNFEEGFSGVKDDERQRYLRQQALVASAHRPQGQELGL